MDITKTVLTDRNGNKVCYRYRSKALYKKMFISLINQLVLINSWYFVNITLKCTRYEKKKKTIPLYCGKIFVKRYGQL